MRYAAFLRGINVGGHRPLKMADLRAALEDLGLQDVRTVLASGNVVFEAAGEGDESALAARIERQLDGLFGYPIRVVLRRLEDLQRLVASAPFAGVTVTPETRLYATFLSKPLDDDSGWDSPAGAEGSGMSDGGLDSGGKGGEPLLIRVSSGEALSVITLAPGRGTPELMAFLERRFGRAITTRSWETVVKVVDS
jgi:uncharacterized protein (DUF1697 family)